MKKSIRNRKYGCPSGLNAGDKTSTNCPPDLNKSVKESILNEIDNFDVQKARKEIEDSANGKPSVDAYHNWVDQNMGHEVSEANPDVLAEDDGLKYITSRKDGSMAILLTDVRLAFSRKELQVWNMVMKHNISQQEAADLLNIARVTLRRHLKRAEDKFRKFMEASK